MLIHRAIRGICAIRGHFNDGPYVSPGRAVTMHASRFVNEHCRFHCGALTKIMRCHRHGAFYFGFHPIASQILGAVTIGTVDRKLRL